MSILRRAVREARSVNLSGLIDPRLMLRSSTGYMSTWAGVPVTETTALQQSTVWSCVSFLADTISSMPIGAVRKSGDVRIPVSPDPILLTRPHPELDFPAWCSQAMVSLAMRGNFFGRVVGYDQNAYPNAIKPLHPDDVSVKRERDTNRVAYKLKGETDTHYRFPAGDIIHVLGFTRPGDIAGLSPIEYARQVIGGALATEEFGYRFFGEGANPSGVLVTPNELDQEAADRLKGSWMDKHGNGSREPAVLSGGVEWKPISITPNESQFLETRQFQVSDIARLYRIPPHIVGDLTKTTTWGSGIEEMNLALAQFTLQPWIVRLETALSALIPRGQEAKFNVAGLLRGRTMDRYSAYHLARQDGWMSIDDIRALEDMAPLPDGAGTDHLQPLNFAPIEGGTPAKSSPNGSSPVPIPDI